MVKRVLFEFAWWFIGGVTVQSQSYRLRIVVVPGGYTWHRSDPGGQIRVYREWSE